MKSTGLVLLVLQIQGDFFAGFRVAQNGNLSLPVLTELFSFLSKPKSRAGVDKGI